MIAAFFVAFGTVFLAELPDKTMVASLVLTTRYRRPLAVWTGVSIAFVLHVVLAVSIGSLLRQLPERPVQLVVAVLFLVGGVLLLRADDEDDEVAGGVPAASFRAVATTAGSISTTVSLASGRCRCRNLVSEAAPRPMRMRLSWQKLIQSGRTSLFFLVLFTDGRC